MTHTRVAVAKVAEPVYPADAPYHPDEPFPEYRFGAEAVSAESNAAYRGVREALRLYGLDAAHFGTPRWNPLGGLISPGDRVVLKPNFVLHHNASGAGLESVVTHPAVLRAVADYAFLALGEGASLTIADAPQVDCDFEALWRWAQLDPLQAFYRQRGLRLEVLDVRKLRSKLANESFARAADRVYADGDPRGYVAVDLGNHSMLGELAHRQRLYGSDYDRSTTVRHHVDGRHEYCVSRTILDADVIINVPKMKVHKKTGLTANLKNLVGINGDKNYLPHFRVGTPSRGGDAYPDSMNGRGKQVAAARIWLLYHLLGRGSRTSEVLFAAIYRSYRFLRDALGIQVDIPIDAGNWHGNDTCWRTVVDLNTILFFADAEGRIQSTPQRRFWSVTDGIIGGELGGPLAPDPAPSGLILVGDNPLALDCAAARLMGFDWRKIPHLAAMQLNGNGHPLAARFRVPAMEELEVLSEDPEIASMMTHARPLGRPYRPHPGWAGHIELEKSVLEEG